MVGRGLSCGCDGWAGLVTAQEVEGKKYGLTENVCFVKVQCS